VMAHVHGGDYAYGAGSVPGYRGLKFARHGIVHVGVNYRLGIDGLLCLGDGPTTWGSATRPLHGVGAAQHRRLRW
jgi:carboxylesterase type B